MRACVEQELEESRGDAHRASREQEGGKWNPVALVSGKSLATLCLCVWLMGRLASFNVVALGYSSWIDVMTVTSTKINVSSLLLKSGLEKTRSQRLFPIVVDCCFLGDRKACHRAHMRR